MRIELSFETGNIPAKAHTFRCVVEHLMILYGVTRWRWEIETGGVTEVIYGPFRRETPAAETQHEGRIVLAENGPFRSIPIGEVKE